MIREIARITSDFKMDVIKIKTSPKIRCTVHLQLYHVHVFIEHGVNRQ